MGDCKKSNKKIDHVSISLEKSQDGHISINVVVNGYYDTPDIIHLTDTDHSLRIVLKWLEHIVARNSNAPVVVEIENEKHKGRYYQLYYQNDSRQYGQFHIFDDYTGLMKAISYCDTEDFVRHLYTRIRGDSAKIQNPVRSEVIESYFLNKPALHFEYNGYFTIAKPSERDLRYYGSIYDITQPETPLENWGFAANNEPEARERFNGIVEKIIDSKKWKERNQYWKKNGVDTESIGLVFDILPEKFKTRIMSGLFDMRLLDKVDGGDYAVPLYYVTKAWDILLKGKLEHYAFKIGPEEDDEDDYEAALMEFMEEEHATRTRGDAVRQNDEMKVIWKEMLGVDIEKLDIDFSQFNMHIPPKVSDSEFKQYFFDVLDGIFERILDGINHPKGTCTFDSVSSLMEFTALIVEERKEWR